MFWPARSAIHLRRSFADQLRRKYTPAFLPITCDEMSLKPYELITFGGWGREGGLGLTTVDGSGCKNVSSHVPILKIPMALECSIYLLIFWG